MSTLHTHDQRQAEITRLLDQVEHRRACLAAAATSALHLAKAGDVATAQNVRRRAERVAQGLTPKDQLGRSARAFITAFKRG